MTKEPQASVSDQVGKRMASGGCSDFHICHMAGVWYPQDLAYCPHVKCFNARALELCGGPCLAPIQQDRDYVSLVEAYLGIQPDA